VIFLLGLARFDAGGLQLQQYFLTGFNGETALLTLARRFIEEAAVLVSYNGKCFDYPLLQTRYRLAQLDDPFAALEHWDLLHSTRRAFARHWPDCRLATVEQRLLGFHRDNDLPGSEVPETWFRWVRQGIADDLPRVLRHNYWDLLSLAALLARLRQCYQAPLAHNADVLAATRHYLERDDEHSAWEHLLAHRGELDERAALELAQLARRRRQWPLALEIWRGLAQNGSSEALLRLAKYYEHVDTELQRALRCTRALIGLQPRCELHRQRERRLLAKIERRSAIEPH
jgi:hypothetical protein